MKEFSTTNLQEWELKIISEFPELFTQQPSPYVKKSIDAGYLDSIDFVNLRYGFECGEGWAKLIREYCQQTVTLLKLLHESKLDVYAKVYGCIMKEKFGTLCIQNDAYIKEEFWPIYQSIVRAVENDSRNICEMTGTWGTLRVKDGWVKTLCDDRARELGFKNA